MSNPALNESTFQKAIAEDRAGWAAPASSQPAPDTISDWPPAQAPAPSEPMRVGGVASATAVLLLLTLISGAFGWTQVTVTTAFDAAKGEDVVTAVNIPAWMTVAWIVGFVIAIVTVFKPHLARFTGALYALAMGLLVGGISKAFEVQFQGIVLQAVLLTLAVFTIMLTLFATGKVRVTQKMRTVIVASTLAIALVYLVSFVFSLFGGGVPYIHDSGPIGIAFSLIVVGVASLNLLLDFDLVQRGVAARAPRWMEWYCAFGLMVTLIWLYLEILRLLAKLRQR